MRWRMVAGAVAAVLGSAVPVGAAGPWYVSTAGNDGNTGLGPDDAWATLKHALAAIPSGSGDPSDPDRGWSVVYVMNDGVHYGNAPIRLAGKRFICICGATSRGAALVDRNDPTTRLHPAEELPFLDATDPRFRDPNDPSDPNDPQAVWEDVSAPHGLPAGTLWATRPWVLQGMGYHWGTGFIEQADQRYRLVDYSRIGSDHETPAQLRDGFDNITTRNQYIDLSKVPSVYVGPGVFSDTTSLPGIGSDAIDRLYLRLEPSALYDRDGSGRPNFSPPRNPNEATLFLGPKYASVILDRCDNIRVYGLHLRNRSIRIWPHSADIDIRHLDLEIAGIRVLTPGDEEETLGERPSERITIADVVFRYYPAPWVTWWDVKAAGPDRENNPSYYRPDRPDRTYEYCSGISLGAAHGVTVERCTFHDAWDGIVATGALGNNRTVVEPENGNGTADTRAVGDDIQQVAPGLPVAPQGVIVWPGPNGALDSKPAGDDRVSPFEALHDVEIHSCGFHGVRDDCIQLGSAAYNIHIHHNVMIGSGSAIGRQGNGDCPAGHAGTKWIHHNIMDMRASQQFERAWCVAPDPHEPSACRTAYFVRPENAGQAWLAPFGTHKGSKLTGYYGSYGDPYMIHNNTLLYGPQASGAGYGFHTYWGASRPSPSLPQRVYNNIFYQLDPQGILNAWDFFDGSLVAEGNLFFREASDRYAPGWVECNGIRSQYLRTFADYQEQDRLRDPYSIDEDVWSDPAFGSDYQPAAAAWGGVDLRALSPWTGIPVDKLGTEDRRYRGAVPPADCPSSPDKPYQPDRAKNGDGSDNGGRRDANRRTRPPQ